MNFLDSAFSQLAFAAKLLEYVEQGKLLLDDLDQPLTIVDGSSIWVLPDRLFHSDNDLHIACANQLSVAFGAAAITLNRCREEFEAARNIQLLARNGNPPTTEDEHFAELVYQIRNAFAHDISEPRWEIRGDGRRRPYLVDRFENGARITADLTNLHGQPFEYAQIDGIETLHRLREFGQQRYWG
ncbi:MULTISPECIES: hypothetical protein [unclassified Caballeronia]|uniref:hypothetical protein n=1 Tax=unclassified Caballeronia TaxID=2646786 RepID=UPI00025B99FB|nr:MULTISPECIES: hypothetical protein [unclassified Caballeronia]EKS70330.1 hypothetical protein BURK_019690 [Burkholderia sp. SJ98]MCE4546397.1 hypothetical protein [Caballeronia sp. PC1]MCE4573128.1 hypothetical protein [Caballeronia sp. CLC5]